MTEREQLQAALVSLYDDLRADSRSRWRRDLPLEELLFDRWERAASLGFGERTSIYHSSYVYGDVAVGSNTWIGPFVLLDGTGGLTIGDNCSISTGVQIYTHDTVKWAVSGGSAAYEHSPVSIGSSCYIGSQSVIAKGVSIGDHCVIGACSFVNRDVPPNTIAGGVPIRRLGRVEIQDGEVDLVIDGDQA
jgi:acetyltransferase-like isoleucine patch superfamily enzyme